MPAAADPSLPSDTTIARSMRLETAGTARDFATSELRNRATDSSKPAATTHYRAVEGDEEVAFVALDVLPGRQFIVLYEVFVRSDRREQGIGLRVMSAVEAHAREQGFRQIKLRPHPLDQSNSAEELRQWYTRQGYAEDEIDHALLQKRL